MSIIEGPDISGLEPLVARGPTIGLPGGTKDRPRLDFDERTFSTQIETKGLRLAWSQSAACPCASANRQTNQPGPTCSLGCNGTGYLYFRPRDYDVDMVRGVGQLTALQRYIVNRSFSPAVVIRAQSIGMERKETTYDRVGQWGEGTVNLTTRATNILAHYDRLTYLDSVLAYTETHIVDEPRSPFSLRYPAYRVDFLRDEDAVYYQGEDFELDGEGRVCFTTGRGPTAGPVLFSARYLHHPQFLVITYLNAIRDSLVRSKRPASATRTPQGDPQKLPIRVMAQLEFLTGLGAAQERP